MAWTGDRLLGSDIPKLLLTRMDCTNWNAWQIEIVRALRLQQVAHYIGLDGGAHEKYGLLKRPQAPELESYREQIGGAIITAQPDRAYRQKNKAYEVAEAAWCDARDLHELKYGMDGISVSIAIAVTGNHQISTRIVQAFILLDHPGYHIIHFCKP